MPLKGQNYLDFMKAQNSSFGAFQIRNSFVPLQWKEDLYFKNNSALRRFPINALRYSQRQSMIWMPRMRSKWIARPEAVNFVEIHFPDSLVKPFRQYLVPETDAIIYHYRKKLTNNLSSDEEIAAEAKRVFEFSDKILERLQVLEKEIN